MTTFPPDYAVATATQRYATLGLYRYLEPDGCDPMGLDMLPLTSDPDAAAALGEAWFATVRRYPTGYGNDEPNDPTPWQPAGRSGVWLAAREPHPVPIAGVAVVASGHAGWLRLHGWHKLYATWCVISVPPGVRPDDAVRSVPGVAAYARGYEEVAAAAFAGGQALLPKAAPPSTPVFTDMTAVEPGRGFGLLIGWPVAAGEAAPDGPAPDGDGEPPAAGPDGLSVQ